MFVSDFYKKLFGFKVYKISVDAGCTCPNRDGTKGFGGCIFCSQNGSGDFIPEKSLSITEQIEKAKILVSKKNKKGKFIVYFQNFTNTYGNIEILYEKWVEALNCKDIVGISIATRPDCIDLKVVEKLKILSEKTFVQLEFGLQTSDEKNGEFINRKYSNSDYLKSVELIKEKIPEIHIVTHLIFGLPNENEQKMLESVEFVVNSKVDGIKISNLYVLKNTKLEKLYLNGDFKVLEMEEYFTILKKALKIIPENVVIHRLTGDGPKSITIAPLWVFNKKKVLTLINELKEIY